MLPTAGPVVERPRRGAVTTREGGPQRRRRAPQGLLFARPGAPFPVITNCAFD